MKKTSGYLIALCFLLLLATSCKKDNEEVNENELITTIEVHATEQGTSSKKIFKWEDVDGAGGANPVMDDIILSPNKVYTVELQLLDKTKTPAANLTDDIRAESANHRFYFEPSSANISVGGLDNDAMGVPFGLRSTWTTTSASTGTMKITLRHYPEGNKQASDLVNNTRSSSDAEVTFNTRIQ